MKIIFKNLLFHARHIGESLRGVLHFLHSAGRRYSASPWNDQASHPQRAGRGCIAAKAATPALLSRLAPRRDEHTLHLAQNGF